MYADTGKAMGRTAADPKRSSDPSDSSWIFSTTSSGQGCWFMNV
jgi:hypothetical protein